VVINTVVINTGVINTGVINTGVITSEIADEPNKRIFTVLESVLDPEVPAISIVDLGIVRAAEFKNGTAIVTITPTYSGCPAMHVIVENIKEALHAAGFEQAEVITVLAPAWSTDWISPAGRERLRAYGIAPPQGNRDDTENLIKIGGSKTIAKPPTIPCPYCDSRNTRLRSEFGPTACKALYSCNACLQPFEYFKPL